MEELFEAFIKLIATAIDKKSPYTGGHCIRVPVLTMMLADAVEKAEYGPYKDFSMTEEERYELYIAGWLHDCGKVATPTHVVDKGTKLERFGVLQDKRTYGVGRALVEFMLEQVKNEAVVYLHAQDHVISFYI